MAVHLVTGHAGTPHVTSADQGAQNSVLHGEGAYIVSGLSCTMTNANTAHVDVGSMFLNGRFVMVTGNGQDVAIDSGAVGVTRTDLICARYELAGNGTESVAIVCKKGAAGGAVPSYTEGNILEGATVAEFPMYRVELNGITVSAPVAIIQRTGGIPLDRIPAIPASKVSGLGAFATKSTLAASDIPSIDASKIASGTINAARIPSLDASKVTSGTLNSARIPTLTTAKLSDAGNMSRMTIQGGTVTVNMPKGAVSEPFSVPFPTNYKQTPFVMAFVGTNRSFYTIVNGPTTSAMSGHVRSVEPYNEAFTVTVRWVAIGYA